MTRDLDRLANQEHDVVIIGGGIYGACAAWEAALRGLQVALVEQGDFGQATSANSQKIVHGGLRYLQSLDFARMRESIRERRSLLRVAPHLVHPLPFVIPTYHGRLRSKGVMAMALRLNDLVSWDRNRGLDDPERRIPPARVISREECLRLIPGVRAEGLTGGALWYDGQIEDSERLTLAFVRSAAAAGATVANYVEVTGLLRNASGAVCGVHAQDRGEGRRALEVRGRVVLNTSGPWVQHVLGSLNGHRPARRTRFLKTVNLLTRPLTNQAVAFGIASPPGWQLTPGFFFFTPWRDCTIIGSTYTPYTGRPEDCQVNEQEIEAFLGAINRAYPSVRLGRRDVHMAHAGLLPAGPDGCRLQRSYRLVDHARQHGLKGLVSVVGVKYTTARDVAEKAVDLVCAKLGKRTGRGLSRSTPLVDGAIPLMGDFLGSALREPLWGLDGFVITHLVQQYGTAYEQVLRLLRENLAWLEPLDTGLPSIKAQVVYAIRDEMAITLADVVFRRVGLGSAGFRGMRALDACAQVMAQELGWDDGRRKAELRTVEALFRQRAAVGPLRVSVGAEDASAPLVGSVA